MSLLKSPVNDDKKFLFYLSMARPSPIGGSLSFIEGVKNAQIALRCRITAWIYHEEKAVDVRGVVAKALGELLENLRPSNPFFGGSSPQFLFLKLEISALRSQFFCVCSVLLV